MFEGKNKLIASVIIGIFLLVVVTGVVWYLRKESMRGLPTLLPNAVTDRSSQQLESTSSTRSSKAIPPEELVELARQEQEQLKKLPPDADHDGLSDAEESRRGTNSQKPNTDGDPFGDFEEIYLLNSDPLRPDPATIVDRPRLPPEPMSSIAVSATRETISDQDSDGLSDQEETRLGTRPDVLDTDGDGLSDRDEIQRYRTDPKKSDSDADTYPDAQEVEKGYNPLGPGKCVQPSCIPF